MNQQQQQQQQQQSTMRIGTSSFTSSSNLFAGFNQQQQQQQQQVQPPPQQQQMLNTSVQKVGVHNISSAQNNPIENKKEENPDLKEFQANTFRLGYIPEIEPPYKFKINKNI